MEKSETIKSLAVALCKFQGGMDAITKDASNPFFKSKYASLSAIIEDTREPLAVAGLSFAQFPTGEAELTTILMHTSGEWMSSSFTMKPVDQKPQSLGSAITYARRYALCSILGLQVDDDDGNEGSKPQKKAWQVAHKQDDYDQSPIPDDVPIIVSGADEQPPKFQRSATEKKARIKALLDKQSLTDLKTKDDYEKACEFMTDLPLKPDNFDEIISKLNALQHEGAK